MKKNTNVAPYARGGLFVQQIVGYYPSDRAGDYAFFKPAKTEHHHSITQKQRMNR